MEFSNGTCAVLSPLLLSVTSSCTICFGFNEVVFSATFCDPKSLKGLERDTDVVIRELVSFWLVVVHVDKYDEPTDVRGLDLSNDDGEERTLDRSNFDDFCWLII